MILEIRKYLSGYFVLNLPAPEMTMGDWHPCGDKIPEIAWFGEREKNTFPYLGAYGLREESAWLRMQGYDIPDPCFVANHFRATLDVVWEYSLAGTIRHRKTLSEQYIDLPKHKREILKMAVILAKKSGHSGIIEWVREECGYSYEFENRGKFNYIDIERDAFACMEACHGA